MEARAERKIRSIKLWATLSALKSTELMDTNSGVKVTLEQVLCLLHELDLQSKPRLGSTKT